MTPGEQSGWAVVVAEGGREEVADRYVSALGYVVDFLWYRKLIERRIIVSGRRVRAPRKDSIVRRSLFGSYGFVLLDYNTDATDIDKAIGVYRLIRHPPVDGVAGRPKRVRASIVEALRQAAASGEFDSPELRPKPPIRTDLIPGTQVYAPGRNDGLIATIRSMDEDGRAEYFISLLGREVSGRFTKDETKKLELVDAA